MLTPADGVTAAVDHPFAIHGIQRQTGRRTEDWTMGGQAVPMIFWSWPLHAMTDAFTVAGSRISVITRQVPS